MNLLKDKQVDLIFHWPFGKSKELAKQGKLPCIWLPDGSLRFEEKIILSLIHPKTVGPALELARSIYRLSNYASERQK